MKCCVRDPAEGDQTLDHSFKGSGWNRLVIPVQEHTRLSPDPLKTGEMVYKLRFKSKDPFSSLGYPIGPAAIGNCFSFQIEQGLFQAKDPLLARAKAQQELNDCGTIPQPSPIRVGWEAGGSWLSC